MVAFLRHRSPNHHERHHPERISLFPEFLGVLKGAMTDNTRPVLEYITWSLFTVTTDRTILRFLVNVFPPIKFLDARASTCFSYREISDDHEQTPSKMLD